MFFNARPVERRTELFDYCLSVLFPDHHLANLLGDISSLHVNYDAIGLDSGYTLRRLQCDTRAQTPRCQPGFSCAAPEPIAPVTQR